MASEKDRYDIAWAIAKTFGAFVIPLVIGYLGYVVQSKQIEESTSAEFVRMAIGILSENNSATPELRRWAIQIINAESPARLPPNVSDALISGDIGFDISYFNYRPNGMYESLSKEEFLESMKTGKIKKENVVPD